jgi:hypothetical protein
MEDGIVQHGIYAIVFDNGAVKVGRGNPENRLAIHRALAKRFSRASVFERVIPADKDQLVKLEFALLLILDHGTTTSKLKLSTRSQVAGEWFNFPSAELAVSFLEKNMSRILDSRELARILPPEMEVRARLVTTAAMVEALRLVRAGETAYSAAQITKLTPGALYKNAEYKAIIAARKAVQQ